MIMRMYARIDGRIMITHARGLGRRPTVVHRLDKETSGVLVLASRSPSLVNPLLSSIALPCKMRHLLINEISSLVIEKPSLVIETSSLVILAVNLPLDDTAPCDHPLAIRCPAL